MTHESGGKEERSLHPALASALRQMQHLYAQVQEDRRAAIPLVQICQQILKLLQSNERPDLYPAIQMMLGIAYYNLPTGERASNLEQAMACYREALHFWTPEALPFGYASLQTNLGVAYQELPTGDRTANLEQAMACHQEALRFWTPESSLRDYALTQGNLGNTYGALLTGNRTANLKQAITCYREALRFWTPESSPRDYALVQSNLGNAYSDLPTGDRVANLEQAIVFYREALRFQSAESTLPDYARTLTSLGNVYQELPTGDRAANLEQAMACYREALRFWTLESAPRDYATTQNSLGNTYSVLPTGDRAANLRQAIVCYQEALRFWTPESAPRDYALALTNLGAVYRDLPTGDRAANLRQAIVCYQEALRFWTPESAPRDYATVLNNLGNVYQQLLTGDRAANLRQAIVCYQEALRFWTPESAPRDYALAQNNLGTAYIDLPTGDRAANLRQAITCFQEALRFRTAESAPHDYAQTLHNLGDAFRALPTGDQAANQERAIVCYQQSLRFLTAHATPRDYAATQNNLGNAYQQLTTGDRVANLRQAITCYQEAQRFQSAESMPRDYAQTLTNLGNAYQQLTIEDQTANLEQAITYYQEALRFWTAETAPYEFRLINSNLAHLHFVQKEWRAALDAYRAAMHAGEQLYRAGLSTESKAAEQAANAALYRHAAFSAVHCGENAEALLILEQGKTRLLSEALRLRISRPAGVPGDVWATYTDAASAVRAVQAESMAFSHQEQDPVQTYAARARAAQDATIALESTITHVRTYAPDFLRDIDLHDAQALLPNDRTGFIAFCITERGSIGLLVTNHSQEVQVKEVPNFTQTDLNHLFVEWDSNGRAIGGWLGAYGHYLKEPTEVTFALWQKTMTQTLDTLGQHLLDPIVSILPPDIEHLILLPSAQLFLFPLHAAPLAGNPSERIGDRYLVSYAPSIEVLANTRAKAMQDVSPRLYAVINPEADPRLVFTQQERTAITRLFTYKTINEGRTGTKRSVLAGVRGQTYLHFSCHGGYDWNTPTASGLDLADGRLTLDELQQSTVDFSTARLVTLSACETGITDVMKGSAEEYVGVPAGFLLTGVPCIVSSLWAVPDLSTALLMERFYSNHLESKMELTTALREAQRWVRTLEIGSVAEYAEQCYDQSDRKNVTQLHYMRYYRSLAKQNAALHPFEHPYYWAAFTVNGM